MTKTIKTQPVTKTSLDLVISQIMEIIAIARRLAPAEPFTTESKTRLSGFQMWVGKLVKGDSSADLGKTYGTGCALRKRLGDELDLYLDGALERFMGNVAKIQRLAPDLYDANREVIEAVVAKLTSATNANASDYSAIVAAHNECQQVLVPLASLAQSQVADAERRAKEAERRAEEAAIDERLARFANLELVTV